MTNYIIRRLLLLIPTVFMVTALVFLTVHLLPGDVVTQLMMEHRASFGSSNADQKQTADVIRQKLGLDAPLHIQYARWISGVVRGDFGKSMWTERPVIDDILQRLPISVELGFIGMIVANLLGVTAGAYAAMRQDSLIDYAGRSFAIIFLSVPGFWLGTMVIVFPSIWWGFTPPMQYVSFLDDPMKNLQMFLIPGILLGLAEAGWMVRFLRTTMLDVLRQDYVRTAWSKGLKERAIMLRHVIRNALIPVVTVGSGQLGVMIGGTVIIEQIFNLPGMGRLFVTSAFSRDYPYISAINLIAGVFALVIILLTDLSYAWIDPRIRYR